jgi:hypothetical protein
VKPAALKERMTTQARERARTEIHAGL